MKIAMFGQKRIPSREGGIEVVVEQLATRMTAMGHQVTCYNRNSRKHPKAERLTEYRGVELKYVPTLSIKGLAAVTSSFFAAVRCAFSKAKVVHIHAEGPAAVCWLPKLFGKRVIVTVHGLDWQREKWQNSFGRNYIHLGEKMAVRFADEIIVLSKSVQNYFMEQYGRRTVWIPNGISKAQRLGPEHLEQFGLGKDEYILFLGRLVPEKGIHYLIEAYKKLDTSKKLVIAGDASDTSEYGDRLHAMAADDPRIVFTGFVQGESLAALYSNAYVYVLPSDLEGMPMSLLEAMSFGNCCVVSNIDECMEVVETNAVSFTKSNVTELEDCLSKLCREPETVERFRQGIDSFVCRKYDWDSVVEQTLQIYGAETVNAQ